MNKFENFLLFSTKTIILLLAGIMFSGDIYAQPSKSSNAPSSAQAFGSRFTNLQAQNLTDSVQKGMAEVAETDIDSISTDSTEFANWKSRIDDQLFVTKKASKDLYWPSFPRIWIEIPFLEQKNISYGASVNINPFALGIKVKQVLSNQYALKTTFVLISSNKPNDPKLYEQQNGQYPITRSVLTLGTDGLNYANIDDNFPMVGFCSFEAKYVKDITVQRNISVFGFNRDQDNSISIPVTYNTSSKLFQVNSKIPIKTYLNTVCREIFKRKIEAKVMSDFEKLKTEAEFQLSLNELNLNTGICEPPLLPVDGQIQESDESCVEWQNANFNPSVISRTLARCKFNPNLKNNYCELRSKENKTCPIYWNMKAKRYETDLKSTARASVTATAGYFELPCDVENGFTCQFTEKPIFLLNTPFIGGRAICKKQITK